jgi:hypothetical protein
MRTHVFVMFVGVVGVAACGKPKTDAPQQSEKPIASPTLPEGTPTQTPAQKASGKYVPTTDVRLMIGSMGQEAQNRPKAGITAEPLFDALEERAAIKLAQREQYMGKTMHAAFCAGGQTDEANTERLIVAMCEYPDDAAAQASLEFMNRTFTTNSSSRREAHHAAVLTVIASRAGDLRVDTAFKVFESL